MPYKDKGKEKAWRLKNRDRLNAKRKQWGKEHIERSRELGRIGYWKHRDDRIKNGKKYRDSYRIQALSHYSGNPPKCKCCGEKELLFLTIDHINGKGSKHRKRIGGTNMYRWLISHNFPEGFQVLCFNCNCGRARNNGTCPHQQQS